MPVLDLLLGTSRLRSEIKTQSLQLGRDIESVKATTAQLRYTAVARFTSPLGLLSAVAAGFIAGKVAGHPSHSQRAARRVIGNIAELTSHTVRMIGLEVIVPFAIEWFRSRFANANSEQTAAANTGNDPQQF
jgi:hypothetical protein